ncbi:MAG: carboxypeptidase M32 [Vicinamibacterales bacterium]
MSDSGVTEAAGLFADLAARVGEVRDLQRAADLIEWDERVYMPPGGAPAHGEMQATLRRIAHETFTSDDMAKALDAARAQVRAVDADSDESRIIAVTARDFEKATKVPAEFVAEQARATSAAQQAWAEARAKSDFAMFRPHLERVIALKRQYVTFFDRAAHPYDILLDDYEPGATTAEVQAVFAALRDKQVALVRELGERPQVDDSFLRVSIPESTLIDFSVEVINAFGFDFDRGRQDKSLHPFCTSFGADDVRITTRYVEGLPLSLLFGTMHETGHALYEQGVSPAYQRTSLEGGASLGIHESQSRLWENIVGRSLPFWEHFFPMLQQRCQAQLGGVSLAQFYKGINRVEPSLIRVEADEATYNLHVMLRVELEIALIEGRLEVKDLDEAWNAGMRDYLGITPPDAARGVLQDIHWSAGLFGYFATYTLGNVFAAQLAQTFRNAHPSLDDEMRRGEFGALLAWLREELHRHGRKFLPRELVQKITGGSIDPAPYLDYLSMKYRQVYS